MPSRFDRYLVTVGPAGADLDGADQRILQAAVDHVAALGGGTVRLLPGRYLLRNALRLRDGVRLEGRRDDTILVKAAEIHGELADDVDWYDDTVTLKDAAGFRVGDGVLLQGDVPYGGSAGLHKVKRTILGIDGHVLRLDATVGKNFWIDHAGRLSTLFPLLYGEPVQDVEIAALTLDGNRVENSHLDGNHDGCIFLQHAARVHIADVTAFGNNGDGISWQVAHDVTVEGCEVYNCAGLGLHPGSGSQRPVMCRNHLHHNQLGLFFCWGVKHGLAEGNLIEDNATHGVSIGHRDTDNLVRQNTIRRNRQTGILLRSEGADVVARLPHRNRLEANLIEDNGGDAEGCGIRLCDRVEETCIVANQLVDRGQGIQRIGIRIEAEVGAVTMERNSFDQIATEVDDLRAR